MLTEGGGFATAAGAPTQPAPATGAATGAPLPGQQPVAAPQPAPAGGAAVGQAAGPAGGAAAAGGPPDPEQLGDLYYGMVFLTYEAHQKHGEVLEREKAAKAVKAAAAAAKAAAAKAKAAGRKRARSGEPSSAAAAGSGVEDADEEREESIPELYAWQKDDEEVIQELTAPAIIHADGEGETEGE